MNCPYKTLKVAKEATQEDIKLSYRVLSKENHPDKGGDNDKMAELSKAYAILSDPDKRKQYDENGTIADSFTKAQKIDGWINKVMSQALSQKDVTYSNLISKSETIFKKELSGIRNNIEVLEDYIDRIKEIISKKCEPDKDGNEIKARRKEQLSFMINQAVTEATKQLNILKEQEEIADEAFEQLKELMSDDDERVWMPSQMATYTATSGW